MPVHVGYAGKSKSNRIIHKAISPLEALYLKILPFVIFCSEWINVLKIEVN